MRQLPQIPRISPRVKWTCYDPPNRASCRTNRRGAAEKSSVLHVVDVGIAGEFHFGTIGEYCSGTDTGQWRERTHGLPIHCCSYGAACLLEIYTTTVAMFSDLYEGSELLAMYALLSVAWRAGAFTGPVLSGTAMVTSLPGLPLFAAVACRTFGLCAASMPIGDDRDRGHPFELRVSPDRSPRVS